MDPATGSAAASLGGYLRAIESVTAPCEVEVHQGSHIGRPSLLKVEIPPTGGIVVSGTATKIS
ncbi:PhzF family phenazine biosynthesis protein [Arthrobacter silviterrae]|uniref:PhzF family phenazine biosynthesis protein n=1 Tax=Arthrobacter silviterrae TaxID=2026658 RepID=UPI0027D7DECA|nr:PhzF family phenazine biosynthesis protein [Arthrobacter silviterrae]